MPHSHIVYIVNLHKWIIIPYPYNLFSNHVIIDMNCISPFHGLFLKNLLTSSLSTHLSKTMSCLNWQKNSSMKKKLIDNFLMICLFLLSSYVFLVFLILNIPYNIIEPWFFIWLFLDTQAICCNILYFNFDWLYFHFVINFKHHF